MAPFLRSLLFGLLLSCAPSTLRARPSASPPPVPQATAAKAPGKEPPPTVLSLAPALPPEPDFPPTLKRLDFRQGEPRLSIRLMERQQAISFSPRGRMRVRFGGAEQRMLEAPAGSRWEVRIAQGRAAQLAVHVQLAELPFNDKTGLAEAQAQWQARGLSVRTHVLGSLYGIAGKVIDNRRYLLLEQGALTPEQGSERQAALLRDFGVRTQLFEEVKAPATGALELWDEGGHRVASAQDHLRFSTLDEAGFSVQNVEFGVGYDFHNFENRSFRGELELTVDRYGTLAAVNWVPMEELLKGLVPSEIFARAHPEALKAQAVTARGEVLAKVGTKHLADPYLLCSEQHCAVYKGHSGEAQSTSAAVEATRGRALFSPEGRLVDSVYSAVCGGHSEDNEAVWGGPPNPSLRGRPDLLEADPSAPSPKKLEKYLAATLPAACRLSTFAQPSKYRWEKRFTAEQVNALTLPLKVGAVQALSVTERGVSGRARLLTVAGERGATQVRGELNIRRLFGMLNSAMFVVTPERDTQGRLQGWMFRGGGWGHGVGMCQTGAIGRAEAGQDYEDILRHYFNGATVAPIY